MPALLDAFLAGGQAGTRDREIRHENQRKSKLAELMGGAYAGSSDPRAGLYGQIAAVDPGAAMSAQKHFGDMDGQRRQRLGQFAAVFDALPDEQKAVAYPQFAAQAKEVLGVPVPDQWDPAFSPRISQIARALGAGGVAGNVQSTYIDAAGNRVAIMRDGSTQILGQNMPTNQIIDTGNGFYGVNKGNLQAAPVMTGGAQQQQAPSGPMTAATGQRVNIDPSLPENVRASIMAAENAGQPLPGVMVGEGQPDPQNIPTSMGMPAFQGAPAQGQQLRSAPKPSEALAIANFNAKQTRILSPEEVKAAGFREGSIVKVDGYGNPSVVQAPPTMNVAQTQKIAERARKEKQSLNASNAKIDDSVKLVDSILAGKSDFGGVTGMGRLGAKIPGTDWADLEAKIERLRGRSAFAELQEMRANSPTGGALGAIAVRELELLQNAATQLQNSQSPEALEQSLIDYRRTLIESKKRMNQAYADHYNSELSGSGAGQPAQSGGGWGIRLKGSN